jgi:MFS transporter, DHA1 family, multidrug resistance protein
MARRQLPVADLFLLKVNPVIRFLIITDVIAYSAAGLLGPIFAIFITDFIVGGGAAVAGVAAAIFLLTKSIGQIPVGALIDRICGDKDDYWFMVGGALVSSLVPLAFLFISTPLELYIVQFILGLSTAFTFPSFMTLFSRYVDKAQEGTTWSIYFALVDLAAAGTAAIGGVLATTAGFEVVIYMVTILGFISTVLYLPIKGYLREDP